VTPFFYPIGILFYAGILYIIGLLLGGKGEFKNFYMLVILILLMLLPFQLIVSFIFFLASLLFPNAGLIIYLLGAVISFPILIYGAYLLTQALKISLNMTTGRAVLVWLIPGALWFFGAIMSIFSLFLLQTNPLLGGEMQSPCSNEEYFTMPGISLVLFEESSVNKIGLHYGSKDKLEAAIEKEGASALQGLSGLTCLEYLDLEGTNVSDISALSELTNLEIITLSETKVTDLSPLRNLINLEELYLTGTPVSDISALRNLTKLKKLKLYQTKVTGISDLSLLKNLKELSLSNTSISNISSLSNLTNLKELELYGTNVSDVSPLSGLTNLKELNLSKTKVIDISALRGLNLTHLKISRTNIPNLSPLKNIKSLTLLELRKTNISESQLSTFKELKNLRILQLDDSISDAECTELKKALPTTSIYKAINTKC